MAPLAPKTGDAVFASVDRVVRSIQPSRNCGQIENPNQRYCCPNSSVPVPLMCDVVSTMILAECGAVHPDLRGDGAAAPHGSGGGR